MARANVPFLSFNRGLLSPKALARVDLDRTRLSAEVFTNWLPKTQGAMTIRPGTKWLGSSLSDTGAEFLEFVASTDDVALVELSNAKMRLWLGEDAHALSLLGRPPVDTTVSFSDTGWVNASSGGAFTTVPTDLIPQMTSATTNGVTVSASAAQNPAWKAADDNVNTQWQDTGDGHSALPSWLQVDFGAGNTKAVYSYSVRASGFGGFGPNAPKNFTLQCNDVDTGTGWSTVDTRTNQTDWALSEKRTFTRLDADTGTVEPFRYWRLNVTATVGTTVSLDIAEIEMFSGASALQVKRNNGILTLNATSLGALAKATKRVVVSDTGTEHSLALHVSRGPVTLRVGSTSGDDDYIAETSLGTGYHNLAFTPEELYFFITFQSDALVDRIIGSLAIGDSGTVEITAPWNATDIENVRYDQSADVVYVDCDGVRPTKIERRGTGRSWSLVDYAPDNGPFLSTPSSSAKMSVSHFFGNTTLNADRPFFTANHVGALMRAFHAGQSGQWRLGALDAMTDAIAVTGLSDTGGGESGERRVLVAVTGTWAGTIILERSFDGEDRGFHPVDTNILGVPTVSTANASATDTGTFSRYIRDTDDNVKVWYRARVSAYTSGVAVVAITYQGGGVTGIARITGYNSNTDVDIEVLSRFSDTGPTDNWQEGYWSDARSFPSAVALHGGRLAHANGGNLFLSVADDYENWDDTTIGDAGPILKTLGSGPVDAIRFLISKLRLIIGTAGSDLTMVSSTQDEALTPTNANARPFSNQGAANLRALPLDTRAVHVQRSQRRLFSVGLGQTDYDAADLTMLVPDLLAAGVVSIAVQRQRDTRLHCVLADGSVAILTYEPAEEVICWSLWETNGYVERAMCLPAEGEDAVFYHVRRTINGATKRYLEKWALEAECLGDTGLSWLADCSRSYTDTGHNTALVDIAPHLVGESVVVWSSDTGHIPGVDRSPDVNGVQTTYAVDTGGDVTLSAAVHHAVAGLPFSANWKSTKLAYAAEAGTALAQVKRVGQIAFCLYKTHNRGILFGSDSGHLDPLPQVIEGAVVDPDQIFETFDQASMPFSGTHNPDSRIHLQAKAPRPATVLAAIPAVQTNERL